MEKSSCWVTKHQDFQYSLNANKFLGEAVFCGILSSAED